MRKKVRIGIIGMAFAIRLFATASVAQTVFLDPGSYVGDSRSTEISGYQLDGNGWFWWGNYPNCAHETKFLGKVGYQALLSSSPKRLASSCLVNPVKCSAARDEAYSYYFSKTSALSEIYLYRKALVVREGEDGSRFNANGQRISLDPGDSSRLWVEGDYLYYQQYATTPLGGDRTRLYRVLRDGSADPEIPVSISGTHFFTAFESFRYFDINGGLGTYKTGYLLLTEGGDLYFHDPGHAATLIRQDVADVIVLPSYPVIGGSTVYTVENSGGIGDAEGRLYSISPADDVATLRYTESGYHLLEVDVANWPDDTPGRVFVHRALPSLTGHDSHTCWRQPTQGSFAPPWEQFISVNFEGQLKGSRDWVYYVHDGKIKGKESDAPPEEIDIEFLALEVTQGVQSLDHGAILVAGKPTCVRGYGELSFCTAPQVAWYTGARLYGFRGGSPLPGSPLEPREVTELSYFRHLPEQRNTGNSNLFEIPSSWTTAGSTTFEMRLNESGSVPETGTDPNNGAITVSFVGKQPTRLKLRPLKTTVSPYWANSPGSGVAEILERCESMLPVSALDVTVSNNILRKLVVYWEVEWQVCPVGVCPVPVIKVRYDPFYLEDEDDNDQMWAIFWLGVDRLTSGGSGDYHVVGTVHPDLQPFNGVGGMSDMNLQDLCDDLPSFSIPNSDWSSVLAVTMRPDIDVEFNTPYGGRTLAHELGHNYGRRHIDQSGGACGGDTPAGPYHTPPFASCTFGDPSDTASPGAVAGFDVVNLAPVPNDQATIADLMSYGPARWTSVWTWNAIANKIPGGLPASAPANGPADGPAGGSWIVIKGFYDTVSGEAFFMPCEILPDGIIPSDKVTEFIEAEAEMPEAHPIEICQMGCGGEVIASHKAIPFPIPLEEGNPPPDQLWFLQVLPCEADMKSIALCHGDTPVAWLPRSPHGPQVSVNDPVHDAALELLHLSWSASDPDGSPLVFSVFLSPDNGASWQSLESNLDTTELTLSTRLLPGGDQLRVRVIACDGMDTAIGESTPFALPLHPPEVEISNLPEGVRIPYGQGFRARIFAYDNEDGLLEPQWSLSGSTATAGVGDSPHLHKLVPGAHTFSAVASDSDGFDTLAQRNFEVLPIEVPETDAPDPDGYCADAAYADAARIEVSAGEGEVAVHLVHSDGRLYVCLSGIPYTGARTTADAGIIIDTDGSASPGDGPGPGDRGFYVDEDGLPWQSSGDGTVMVAESEPPLGFVAAIQRGTASWSAEFCIEDSLVNGWNHAARIAIDINLGTGAHSYWPPTISPDDPSTWAAAWFGTLPAQPNQAPIASVPEQMVAVASQFESIVLHGDASTDPDGDGLTFNWTQIGGPMVALQGAGTSAPSFVPPGVGGMVALVFELTVNDGSLPSLPAQTTVLLLPDPVPFVAEGVGGASIIIVDIEHLPETGMVQLLFAGQPGESYDILRSVDGESWPTVATGTAGVMGRFSYSEPVSSLDGTVLFQAREQP